MKWSNYNEFIDRPQNNTLRYVFNYFQDKILLLDSRLAELITDNQDRIDTLEQIHPDLYERLLADGFIVNDSEMEVKQCIQKLDERFRNKEKLRLTINPTLDCNLRCWYCYETHLKGSAMEAATMEGVINLVKKEMKHPTLKIVQLSFFGGEPLLQYNKIVEPLVKEIHQLCQAHNIQFELGFTSNAVLFTPKRIDKLLNIVPVFHIQVPFDGNRTVHNSIKMFANGTGSFDMIKKNMEYAIKRGVNVNVRCNYTSESLESFHDLLQEFKAYWHSPNLYFSFHRIWQDREKSDMALVMQELGRKLDSLGIQSNLSAASVQYLTPCYADYENNLLINYNGDVFRCTALNFEHEDRIAELDANGDLHYTPKVSELMKNRFLPECYSCKVLPICTVCSQSKITSIDRKCPSRPTEEMFRKQIRLYFHAITQSPRI